MEPQSDRYIHMAAMFRGICGGEGIPRHELWQCLRCLSPRWAQSFSVWLVVKHSSHHFLDTAFPVKNIVYMVVFTTDHRMSLVMAACCRYAMS